MKKLFISIVVALVLTAAVVPVISVSAHETALLDYVVILPASATVAPLGMQQFTATGENSSNQAVSGVTYSWTVVSGGGTISNTGLFTAGAVAGTYTNTVLVTAIKGNVTKTANANVTVAIPGLLDHVVISPDSAIVAPLGTQLFTAVGQDAFNQAVSDVALSWSVVNGGGSIINTGLFTAGDVAGVYNNTVKVTAVKGDITKTDNATVTVTSGENEFQTPHGWSMGKKTGWGGGNTPPGWSKGNKTGWNGKSTPPNFMK